MHFTVNPDLGRLGVLLIAGAAVVGAVILYIFIIGVRTAEDDITELDERDEAIVHGHSIRDVQIVTDHGIQHRLECQD
jgi:hypothetical protein